ncbi:hypothetical protein NXC24_PC01923 (plasmid) [Rhizobium sp. NXC24]|nr:hypothetical protein NXC24_PC01923 [Rhizobium sp. NXC24]
MLPPRPVSGPMDRCVPEIRQTSRAADKHRARHVSRIPWHVRLCTIFQNVDQAIANTLILINVPLIKSDLVEKPQRHSSNGAVEPPLSPRWGQMGKRRFDLGMTVRSGNRCRVSGSYAATATAISFKPLKWGRLSDAPSSRPTMAAMTKFRSRH